MSLEGKFESTLKQVNRGEMKRLVKFLKEKDFFIKPASIKYHHNGNGGLIRHSWEVYTSLRELNEIYGLGIGVDSIIIEGLLHDIVKVDAYTKGKVTITSGQDSYLKTLLDESPLAKKYDLHPGYAENGRLATSKEHASNLIDYLKTGEDVTPPEREQEWDYKDERVLPAGHGEASVMMLQDFFPLKDREMLAIRWHMGAWEDEVTGGKNRLFNQAQSMYPDIIALQIADYESLLRDRFEEGEESS